MTSTPKPPTDTVQQQLDASREWFESSGARGEVATFDFDDLRGVDLSDAILVEAHLREANLAGCNLVGAKLMGADAAGLCCDRVDARHSDWAKAQLEAGHFEDARLAHANFRKARLGSAVLRAADLLEANLEGAVCIATDFEGASMRGVNFAAALLSGANLRGAALEGAVFDRTVVDEDTVLVGAAGLSAAKIVSIATPDATLQGWQAAAWLARRAIAESPKVALQAYLLAQMSNAELVEQACHQLAISVSRAHDLRALLSLVFDVPGHHAAEYERWLGPPISRRLVTASGEFAESQRSVWNLPAFPGVDFGVSAHASGYAWDVRFESAPLVDASTFAPWRTTYDQLVGAGATMSDVDEWPPMREGRIKLSDGRSFDARFDFDLLQRWDPVA